ncbi:MAG: hypothetical protein M1824_005727 [Vezdaea acicularis]|nr:MAG: hypothetical protein M1824_005727 [Vezdaea acicularis]
MLTPIKVSGKTNRDQSIAGLAAVTAENKQSIKRRPGRPRKPLASSSRSSSASYSSCRSSTKKIKPSRSAEKARRAEKMEERELSHLERLPIEILQKIFLESMNADLPFVSKRVLQNLSNDHIRFSFCINAFRDEIHGDSVEQSAVLSRRYLTQARYHKLRDEICKLSGRDFIQFAGGTLFPSRLLHGSWTREKAWMLHYVTQGFEKQVPKDGKIFKPFGESSTNGEIVEQGLKDAIIEGKGEIVAYLLDSFHYFGLSCTIDHILLALTEGGCNLDVLCVLARRATAYRLQETLWIVGSPSSRPIETDFSGARLTRRFPNDQDWLDPRLWQWVQQRSDWEERHSAPMEERKAIKVRAILENRHHDICGVPQLFDLRKIGIVDEKMNLTSPFTTRNNSGNFWFSEHAGKEYPLAEDQNYNAN